MIGRRKPKGLGNVPELTREEVERRVGARVGGTPTEPEPEAGGASTSWDGEPAPILPVAPDHGVTIDRRRLLWRDSATILIGLVLVLLALQVLAPGGTPGAATGTASPEPIVAIGSSLPQATLGPGETFGPIVDPSIGIDATPTPIPVITMGPSPTPGLTLAPPGPTPRPTGSPRPTPRPTPKPTPKPTAAPTPTEPPAPTDVPAPVAHFSCIESAGLMLSCTDASTDADAWTWDWGDGTTQDTGQNPPTHAYATDISPVTVQLTVTGPGPGTNSVTHEYTLIP